MLCWVLIVQCFYNWLWVCSWCSKCDCSSPWYNDAVYSIHYTLYILWYTWLPHFVLSVLIAYIYSVTKIPIDIYYYYKQTKKNQRDNKITVENVYIEDRRWSWKYASELNYSYVGNWKRLKTKRKHNFWIESLVHCTGVWCVWRKPFKWSWSHCGRLYWHFSSIFTLFVHPFRCAHSINFHNM